MILFGEISSFFFGGGGGRINLKKLDADMIYKKTSKYREHWDVYLFIKESMRIPKIHEH